MAGTVRSRIARDWRIRLSSTLACTSRSRAACAAETPRREVADPLAAAGSVGAFVEAMLAAAAMSRMGQRAADGCSCRVQSRIRRVRAPMPICPRARWPRSSPGARPAPCATARCFAASTAPAKRPASTSGPSAPALSAQSVTLVYRQMLDEARAAGLLDMIDNVEFAAWRAGLTAHSTRVGLTQELFASGEGLAGIMQALRWKGPAQPARYAQALAVESNEAARVVSKFRFGFRLRNPFLRRLRNYETSWLTRGQTGVWQWTIFVVDCAPLRGFVGIIRLIIRQLCVFAVILRAATGRNCRCWRARPLPLALSRSPVGCCRHHASARGPNTHWPRLRQGLARRREED